MHAPLYCTCREVQKATSIERKCKINSFNISQSFLNNMFFKRLESWEGINGQSQDHLPREGKTVFARGSASAGMGIKRLNMLHAQIGALAFPSGFGESAVKSGWRVKRPKNTLVFTKQVEQRPAAFHLVWQMASCRGPNGLHEDLPLSRQPWFLTTLLVIQIEFPRLTLGHWETQTFKLKDRSVSFFVWRWSII